MDDLTMTVKITITGTATGTYPVGQISDALYQILDFLADLDRSGPGLRARLPRELRGRTGIGTALSGTIEIVADE